MSMQLSGLRAWTIQRISAIYMALFIIALAAAEVGIGIAIVLMIFRNRRTADVDDLNVMRY